MNTNNSSPNNFSNNVHESNLQTTTTQAYDTYDTYTYSNNVNNAIFDQQSMSDNTVSHQQYQQSNVASPNHNHQQQYQYIHQPGIPNNTATIIIMPTTNSDIQNQLQQVLAYLNRSQQ
ncbi:hypothetical protein RhiirA5_420062 [Rhizophagus irregularis]|uniref:Uncharacterized protein n=1 Tax=Rhizophagus irregularis TaxID=588596 RepID=A0A2N0PGX8_9GLOM|nr:hypothetical protein RhiirA5_420062 [Rhizophagus irregularis]